MKYNAEGKCPKCGFNDVSTNYHLVEEYGEPCWCEGYEGKEHFDRCCGRCRYKWTEEVLK